MQLSVLERAALAEYQSSLLARFPQRIRRLTLFGSKVRGDAGPDSDVDISPTVIGEDEFEDQPPLVQTIVKEGIELWTSSS